MHLWIDEKLDPPAKDTQFWMRSHGMLETSMILGTFGMPNVISIGTDFENEKNNGLLIAAYLCQVDSVRDGGVYFPDKFQMLSHGNNTEMKKAIADVFYGYMESKL